MNIFNKMKILAIGAHFDDIELACGGMLAKAIENNHEIATLTMSDSGYKDFNGKQIRDKSVACQEGFAAAHILGQEKNIYIEKFKTKDIPYNSQSVEAINRILDKFDPDMIFTHWVFDTHQDHKNVSLATISAARYYKNIFMYEPFFPSGRSYHPFRPQAYVNISPTINKKINSIKCYKSELKKFGNDWIDGIKGRARLRGIECGYKYAEVFEPVRYELKI